MLPIAFEIAIVERAADGAVLIVLIDKLECVAMLSCSDETTRALLLALGSVLNEPKL